MLWLCVSGVRKLTLLLTFSTPALALELIFEPQRVLWPICFNLSLPPFLTCSPFPFYSSVVSLRSIWKIFAPHIWPESLQLVSPAVLLCFGRLKYQMTEPLYYWWVLDFFSSDHFKVGVTWKKVCIISKLLWGHQVIWFFIWSAGDSIWGGVMLLDYSLCFPLKSVWDWISFAVSPSFLYDHFLKPLKQQTH